jgi:hypothetical protein
MKKTIVFYGASVTQQTTNRNGDRVGYVPNAVQRLLDEFDTGELDFHQLGFGSNHFNDVGYIRFNEVIALKPNIVVLEWHSTGVDNFESAKYDFVIEKLHKIGCKVVSLILPLRRCIGQPERKNIKQSRWYQKKGLIQINFYHLIDREFNLDACLRDEVHTNLIGGVIYGRIVARTISDILKGKVVDSEFGDEVEPTSTYKDAPRISSYKLDGCELNSDQILIVEFRATGPVQLFADSVIGPYSPILDVESGLLKYEVNIFDQWCSYKRQCLKPITRLNLMPENKILITVSMESPEHRQSQKGSVLGVNFEDRKLSGIERLFMLGGEIVAAKLEKKSGEQKINVLIFANCHGSVYKAALNEADRENRLNVEHVISYENISRFSEIKYKFSRCDILIIQPVKKYPDFYLENLKKILKNDCTVIRIPFVRFDGFWDVNDVRHLKKFAQPAVMFFPNIRHINEIGNYLRGDNCDDNDIKNRFELSIADFKKVEAQGDVKLVDFFIENYKAIPLFRDCYHPTKIFYGYISHQIVGLVKLKEKSLIISDFKIPINWPLEYGHFKPITNKVASVLGLQFDLNSYFKYTRYDYISRIVSYENDDTKTDEISDLVSLNKVLDQGIGAPEIKTRKASNQNITLFVPYYDSSDNIRQNELITCLRKNVVNKFIDKIFLLIDDGCVPEVTSDKIEIIYVKDRPTFLDWLELTKSRCASGISVLANTDIYFDESISKLKNIFVANNEFVALSRYDKIGDALSLHINPHWSQDVWAISANASVPESLVRMANIKLGIPRCDNKIAYVFSVNGFKLFNPCHDIRSVHIHESGLRNYHKNDLQLVGMLAFVYPSSAGLESRLDHQLWALNFDQIEQVNINKALEFISDKQKLEGIRVISSGGRVIAHDANWQYPAITEQHAYLSIRDRLDFAHPDSVYFGFPWATLFDLVSHNRDQSYQLMEVLQSYAKLLRNHKRVVTVCQHIHMLRFQEIFFRLGITDIFWSHAIKGQNRLPSYPSITLLPFPLYPVQAKNGIGLTEMREYLYSFVGARSQSYYLTDTRNYIIDFLSGDARGYVRGKDTWHYNKIVYDKQIKKNASEGEVLIDDGESEEFKRVIENSVFSLCPSGSGPNSIRLWESLSYETIPVIMSDTYLPPGNIGLWEAAAVFCEETDQAIKELPERLEILARDPELLASKRHAIRQLWYLYGPENFVYDIQKLFIGLANNNFDTESEWKNAELKNLAFDISSSEQVDLQTMEILLMSIGSRLLASPEEFIALYNSDEKIRTACILSLSNLPTEKVASFLKIADYRKFKTS